MNKLCVKKLVTVKHIQSLRQTKQQTGSSAAPTLVTRELEEYNYENTQSTILPMCTCMCLEVLLLFRTTGKKQQCKKRSINMFQDYFQYKMEEFKAINE